MPSAESWSERTVSSVFQYSSCFILCLHHPGITGVGAVYFRILNNKKPPPTEETKGYVCVLSLSDDEYMFRGIFIVCRIILTTGCGNPLRPVSFILSVRTDNSCNFFPAVDTGSQCGMKSNNSQCKLYRRTRYAGKVCVRIVCEGPVTGGLLPSQFPPVSHQYKKLPSTVSATTLFRTIRDARTWHQSRLKPHYPL